MFHELIIICKGRLLIEVSGKKCTAEKGDIIFYPEGVTHSEITDPNDPVETLYLGWEGSLEQWDLRSQDVVGRIRLIAEWLYEEETKESGVAPLYANAFLEAILAELSRINKNMDQDKLVQEVRFYMRKHLTKPITLDMISDQVCLSKFYLIRKYKLLTGLTPMQDLQILRVKAAKDLIISTDWPLKLIVTKVGLSSTSNLSRLFQKYFHIPPGYFRKDT